MSFVSYQHAKDILIIIIIIRMYVWGALVLTRHIRVCPSQTLQVVRVHQETVDLYLEDIILGAVEQTADQQAREDIHRRAKEVNDIAYAVEER